MEIPSKRNKILLGNIYIEEGYVPISCSKWYLDQHARASDEFMPRQDGRELGGPMRAWMSVDGQRPAGIPDDILGLGSGLHLIEPGAYTWHVMVADTSRGKVYLLYDATDNEERVHDFGLIDLKACPIVINNNLHVQIPT